MTIKRSIKRGLFSSGAGTSLGIGAAILTVSNLNVPEGSNPDLPIGTISVSAPGTWVFSIPADADAGDRVTVSGNILLTTSTVFDYDTEDEYIIRIRGVRAEDSFVIEQSFTLRVIDVEEPILADFYVADIGTGSGLTAGDPANWVTAWAAAQAGDTIKLVGETTVPAAHVWNKSVTVLADQGAPMADPIGDGGAAMSWSYARTQTLVLLPPGVGIEGHIRVAANTRPSLKYLKVHFKEWPEEGQTWANVGQDRKASLFYGQSATSEFSMVGCEPTHGYGPDNDPYDTDVKYPEFRSPATYSVVDGVTVAGSTYTGWGGVDPLGIYNTIWWAPQLMGGRFRYLEFKDNYVHDMSEGIKILFPAAATIDIANNYFQRIAGDAIRLDCEGNTFLLGTLNATNTMFQDVGFMHEKDAGNPHGDILQIYSSFTNTDGANPTRFANICIANLFATISKKGVRGLPQFLFAQISSDHQQSKKAIADYPKVRNCMSIGAAKAFESDTTRDLYYRDCLSINPSWYVSADGSVNEATVFVRRSFTASAVLRLTTTANRSLIFNSIFEDFTGDGDVTTINSTITGLKGSTVNHTTLFATPGDPGAGEITPHAMYNRYARIGGHTSKGPQFATLRELLTASTDFSGEPPFIGWVHHTGANPSTQYTSNLAYLHGGNVGDVLEATLGAGVEVRQLNVDRTTVFTDWSSASPQDLTVGKYQQMRYTSPTGGGSADKTVTIDGNVFTLNVTSAGSPTLQDLVLTPDDIAEDAVAGTYVGTLTGMTGGSTLSIVDTSGNQFALDGEDVEVGATALDYETETTPTITIRETLTGATNTPHDTVIPINVTNVAEGSTYSTAFTGTAGTLLSAIDDWDFIFGTNDCLTLNGSGVLRKASGTADPLAVYFRGSSTAAQTVKLDLLQTNTAGAVLMGSGTALGNFNGYLFRSGGSTALRVYRVNNGTIEAGALLNVTVADILEAECRIALVGGNPAIQLYSHGVAVGSPYTDSSSDKKTSGKVGIFANTTGSITSLCDNWFDNNGT